MKIIKRDCHFFINEFIKNDIVLYSGRTDIHNSYIKAEVRKNRKPLGFNITLQNMFDDSFKKKFGITIRKNCLFCTFNENLAGSYGIPYVIFPINKYRYF